MMKEYALGLLLLMGSVPCFAGLKEGNDAYEKKDYTTALKEFMPLAEQGNADAQFMLGAMYEVGRGGLEKNIDEATNWYIKSASQDTSDAGNMGCAALGSLLRKMIEQNINQDKDWFSSVIGQKCIAKEYTPENDAESFKWHLKAAKQGDAQSQALVGLMYYQGKVVAQNYSQALIWFLKAAEQEHVPSQGVVGEMYAEGKGTTQDYAKALEWYRKAAEKGDSLVKYHIAIMYEKGEGVPQNHLLALDLYRQAAEQGNITAQFTLGLKYKEGENVPQNYTQAADWYRKAATQGDSDSQNNLGVMYKNGEGVTKNWVLAHMLYNLAAINGDETAKDNRDRVTPQLTTAQLNEAQELASKWVKGQPLPTVTKTYPSSSKKRK